MQETNTFSPIPTGLAQFRQGYLHEGDALIAALASTRLEIGGFLSVLAENGDEPVPLLAAHAPTAGTLGADTFSYFASAFAERLAAAGPVDGILLALHGALVADNMPDADGAFLAHLRALVPAHIPIGVSLDLHGHITPLMLQQNTFFVGYRNYPHTDIFETGVRTARLMIDTIEGRRRPVMALAKRPMLVSAAFATTKTPPLSDIAAKAREHETGAVLHTSIFPVQPWLDVPDLGFAVLATADGDEPAARAAAEAVADYAWSKRHAFTSDLVSLENAIDMGISASGTTVVSDSGDAPAGGGAADSAAVLRALAGRLDTLPDRPILLTLCDPDAAQAAHRLGVGGTAEFSLGHHFSDGTPVTLTAAVAHLSDGRYTMTAEGATGMRMQMGDTAVLAAGPVRILVRSHPSIEWDTEMYRSQRLEPTDAALVFVKSPAHFRAAFGPIAARILVADTPGVTCADLTKIDFRNVTRPLFPLDDI